MIESFSITKQHNEPAPIGGWFFVGGNMTNEEQQHVIDELQTVIADTQATLQRFEDTGMDKEMPKDYEKLQDILDGAVKRQREHTRVMLG